MPKVSVIVPNYNHARFLEQRIQSILNQTYQDFEIIYLDDFSTDNSNEVFAQFADDPRIRSILNQSNSGSPFKQWNKGIKAANGEYIWIAESDDDADPKLLETLVSMIEKDPRIGIAYCQSRQIDEHNNQGSTLDWWTEDLDQERWKKAFINQGLAECRDYLVFKNTIPNASAVLTRKLLFEKIGYAEETLFLCGDWISWIRLLFHADIAFTAQPLNYYRKHNSTVRSSASRNGLDIYERMQIYSLIKDKITIPQATSRKILKGLIRDWVSLMLRKQSGLSSERNFNIYKLCKTHNIYLELDLIWEIGLYSLRRLRQRMIRATS